MSYTNYVNGLAVTVICAADPEGNYNRYGKEIKKAIVNTGYKPETSYDNIVTMVILHFDSDDNYGEYDPETGCGGYGDSFTVEECLRYVEESGGWREFDYVA